MADTDTTEHDDDQSYRLNDPQKLARNMVRAIGEGGRVVSGVLKSNDGSSGPYSGISEIGEASKILGSVAQQWMSKPSELAEAQGKLMQGYADLWNRSFRRLLGEDVEPVIEPEPGDNRFKDEDWTRGQFFDFWKQAYLLTSNWAEDLANFKGRVGTEVFCDPHGELVAVLTNQLRAPDPLMLVAKWTDELNSMREE